MKSLRMFGKALVVLVLAVSTAFAQFGGELRFCVRAEPKTFNPLMVEDVPSETVRYLTGGVLVRMNRGTQKLEPELATSWKVSDGGRRITFNLRQGVYFSDGTPFTSEDVAFTVRQMMDRNVHSPVGDSFRSSDTGETVVTTPNANTVSVLFPAAVAGVDGLFDQVAIMSAKSPKKEMAVLGPFYVADHKAGSYVLLKRNTNYWKKDASARRLPYLDSIRIDIQQNRDLEVARFKQGELHLLNALETDMYERVAADKPAMVRDLGVSLDSEHMWFNQVPSAPLPDYKKAWFTSTAFRRAVSEAINRRDLARIAFANHAQPSAGPTSPANKFWYNAALKPHPYDTGSALRRLTADGFRLEGNTLKDKSGHVVEFSIVTNAGNKSRERMAALIQQDLAKIGMKINVVPLDFPSLIDRITHSFNYEAAILGVTNIDLDPNTQMALWLSSAPQHAWYPQQKQPATAWEAEIDKLMQQQAAAATPRARKAAWDRVQQIEWDQEPIIYLLDKDAMAGVSPVVKNVEPSVLYPQVIWNIERLALASGGAAGK